MPGVMRPRVVESMAVGRQLTVDQVMNLRLLRVPWEVVVISAKPRRGPMDLKVVTVENPEGLNIVLGQTHFIKSAEDLYEAVKNSVPGAKFGLAFCEASGPRLVRVEGNDEALRALAAKNAMAIGAGHTFCLILKEAFPVNVLRAIQQVPEVCSIFAATANALKVVVAQDGDQRGVLGVLDGQFPLGVEDEAELQERRKFLRRIGYKF